MNIKKGDHPPQDRPPLKTRSNLLSDLTPSHEAQAEIKSILILIISNRRPI